MESLSCGQTKESDRASALRGVLVGAEANPGLAIRPESRDSWTTAIGTRYAVCHGFRIRSGVTVGQLGAESRRSVLFEP